MVFGEINRPFPLHTPVNDKLEGDSVMYLPGARVLIVPKIVLVHCKAHRLPLEGWADEQKFISSGRFTQVPADCPAHPRRIPVLQGSHKVHTTSFVVVHCDFSY